MTDHPVFQEARSFALLRQRIKHDFPDVDDETLQDTLDGLSDLRDMLVAIIRSYLDDRSLATALRGRISEMQERLARYERRWEKKRDLVSEVMAFSEISRMTEPEFTVSLRSIAPSLVIVDEAAVPSSYRIPQPPKLDRQALLKSLRQGVAVPGARLDQRGRTIAVRTR